MPKPIRLREPVSLPEGWGRGPLAEVAGFCLNALHELAEDVSAEAVGQRRALARVIKAVREIQTRGIEQ